MERLKGFLIILLCNLLGNLLIVMTGLPIPGSVIGLLLLLALLLLKKVKLETVEPAGGLLTALLMLFILPGGVNMMNSFHKFDGILVQALLVGVLTTLLSLLSAGWTVQAIGKLRKKRSGEAKNDEPV